MLAGIAQRANEGVEHGIRSRVLQRRVEVGEGVAHDRVSLGDCECQAEPIARCATSPSSCQRIGSRVRAANAIASSYENRTSFTKWHSREASQSGWPATREMGCDGFQGGVGHVRTKKRTDTAL